MLKKILLIITIIFTIISAGCFGDDPEDKKEIGNADLDNDINNNNNTKNETEAGDGNGDGEGDGDEEGNETDSGSEKNNTNGSGNETDGNDHGNETNGGSHNKTDGGGNSQNNETNNGHDEGYYVHTNILTTIFWIGEEAKEENGWVSNSVSAWDDKWQEHYGGVDDPDSRNGYYPSGFTPGQNPFYFSMPYNDFDGSSRRADAYDIIPWSDEKGWGEFESMCKNRWIAISYSDKTVYAQWEDTGPFWEDDGGYVFGEDRPIGEKHDVAGLDISPAVRDYIGISNHDRVDWQFIDFKDVPDGPWKNIVTTMQVYWE
jgi:hypothetical protein